MDGAFNSAVTPDISGALAPVVQPFLGQLVTGAFVLQLLPSQGSTLSCMSHTQLFHLRCCSGTVRTSGRHIMSCRRCVREGHDTCSQQTLTLEHRLRCLSLGCACWWATRCSILRRRLEPSIQLGRYEFWHTLGVGLCLRQIPCAGVDRCMAWRLPSSRCAALATRQMCMISIVCSFLFSVVFSVVLWAVDGTAREMYATAKKRLRGFFERCEPLATAWAVPSTDAPYQTALAPWLCRCLCLRRACRMPL